MRSASNPDIKGTRYASGDRVVPHSEPEVFVDCYLLLQFIFYYYYCCIGMKADSGETLDGHVFIEGLSPMKTIANVNVINDEIRIDTFAYVRTEQEVQINNQHNPNHNVRHHVSVALR
eukprot:scaffold101184_cov68-Cyclotella_meneghiniana.AAC.3